MGTCCLCLALVGSGRRGAQKCYTTIPARLEMLENPEKESGHFQIALQQVATACSCSVYSWAASYHLLAAAAILFTEQYTVGGEVMLPSSQAQVLHLSVHLCCRKFSCGKASGATESTWNSCKYGAEAAQFRN